MGWEKHFAINLRAIAQGEGKPAGYDFHGGSPNHWALAAANAYAFGLTQGTAAMRRTGTAQALSFFARQRQFGHMARTFRDGEGIRGGSEVGTTSHIVWWQAAIFGMRWFAFLHQDRLMLEATRLWLRGELALEKSCAVPGTFHVVMPGARTFIARDAADQRMQMDQAFEMILEGRWLDRSPKFWEALDRTGLYFLRLLLEKGDDLGGAAHANESDLPTMLDPMHVRRTAKGHVAWFDHFTGTCPAFYAWVDYETGEERWGADRNWPKNHPGGVNPYKVPDPPGWEEEGMSATG